MIRMNLEDYVIKIIASTHQMCNVTSMISFAQNPIFIYTCVHWKFAKRKLIKKYKRRR